MAASNHAHLKISRLKFPEVECIMGRLGCIANVASILSIILLPLNPNKAALFEGSFFWGEVNLTLPLSPPSYFKKNLSNINITLSLIS